MADYTITLSMDPREALAGFRQMEQAAQATGQVIGQRLDQGVQRFSTTSLAGLQAELNRLQQRQLTVGVNTAAFDKLGQRINEIRGQIDAAQRQQLAIGVDDRSVVALQAKLRDLQAQQVKVGVDTQQFDALGREIAQVQNQLSEVERKRILVSVDDRSLSGLQAKLQALQAQQVQVDVNSAEFVDLQREITKTQAQIAQVEQNKVLIDVDPNSVVALNTRLRELQDELGRVSIGSERFRELQSAIEDTQRELARAGESSDQFRLLDGVIQGVAFSLSNALVDGAGRAVAAIGGLVSSYAQLDTVIRQAAAADGGANAYATLSSTIDKVGIDAAGTQQQVAELSLELVRGGLTADQVSQSLGGIVRGAEATATAYDRMGEIVSAALTSFGLSATETTRVVDALVQGANSSATDVSGLGEAFKTAAPAAKLLGVSVEDLTTAVGLFTNAGITAGEAGTTLRNGLSQLGSAAPQTGTGISKLTGQAKEAADAMKVLKLDIYNANGTLKPMETVLLQLKGAFDKLAPAAQLQLASKLFGGTDDGTKWLAVLGQSEEKIKAMATAMDGARGATDRNRDAMQGFQLTMQQLTGTIGSLGNNIGQIAVRALLPLVQAANSLAGAIYGLPAPVKDTVIALGLLAGSVVGATLSLVVFQKAVATTQVQEFISGVLSIASAMRANLAGAATVAIVAFDKFIAGVKSFTVANVISSIQALAVSLKTTLSTGLVAARQALVSFMVYLRSVSFASLIGSIGSAIATLGPFVLAIAAVGAAVVAWQKLTGDASKVQKDFAELHKASADSTKALEAAIGSLGNQTSRSTGQMMTMIDVLASWKAINQLVIEINNLTASMDTGFEATLKFIGELNKGGQITDQTTARAKAFTTALNEQIGVLQQARSAARERLSMLEASGQGQTREAQSVRSVINALDNEIAARERAKEAILRKTVAQAEANGQNAADLNLTKEQIRFNEERAKTEDTLNKILREAPVRNLEQQLAVGQQLLSLAQAIGQAEQSRFSVTSAALNFELQKAQERGASETLIKSIKDQIAANDRAALSARYQALQAEQQLQIAMLQLSQEKARAEANVAVLEQRANILKAEAAVQEGNLALSKAKSEEERLAALSQIAAAEAQVGLQREILGVRQGSVELLGKTQPLERAALGYQQESARLGLQNQAAAMGYRIAIDGTLQPMNALAALQGQITTLTTANATEQQRYTELARQSGIAIGTAKDGTVVLGRTQQEVNTAVEEMNKQLAGSKNGFDEAGNSADVVRESSNEIGKAIAAAGGQPIDGLISGFTNTSGTMKGTVVQAARDFNGWLVGAGNTIQNISKLGLDTSMEAVATQTGRAATSAQTFYDWLNRASDLPGSRWTGGPVEAGGEYRINELGQEAFLSAGRLSLIDAAPNSIWRAPSEGVVIPAGITARLQATGAVPVAAGSAPAGVAELAMEVGKLRQEVGNLARRDWSVRVTQRTGPTGSQVLRTLLS